MRSVFALALAATLLAAATALALMPPHITRTVPPDGGTLTSDTVEFHGYSLGIEEPGVVVVDETVDAAVAHDDDLDCVWEGEGDCPGCRQQRCVLKVTLGTVAKGHRYGITYMGRTIHVTAAIDKAKPAPAPTPGKPAPGEPAPGEPAPAKPAPPKLPGTK